MKTIYQLLEGSNHDFSSRWDFYAWMGIAAFAIFLGALILFGFVKSRFHGQPIEKHGKCCGNCNGTSKCACGCGCSCCH